MPPLDFDLVCERLHHLLAVEGYGRGFGMAAAVRPAWAGGRRVPALVVCRTVARLRAWPPEGRARALDAVEGRGAPMPGELRALVEGDVGQPPTQERLGPAFAEAILPDDAEINARMAQGVRRIRYLICEEGLHGDRAPALAHADATQRLIRHVTPGPAAYLLDAATSAADPAERSAWLHLLRYRYATKMDATDPDDVAIRKVAGWLAGYSGESRALDPALVARLIARGLLPAGFTAPPADPASPGRDGGT